MWGCEVPHNLKENDIHYSVMILKSVSPGYHFNKNTLLRKSYFSVFAYWTSTIKWTSSSTSSIKLFEHFLHFLILNHHCTINTLRGIKKCEKKREGNKKVLNLLVRIWTSFVVINSALTCKTDNALINSASCKKKKKNTHIYNKNNNKNKKTCLAKTWGPRQKFCEFHCKLH